MITHNEIVTVLGAALSLVVFMLGYWRGHYRAYAECCDCCTCQTCTEDGDEFGQTVMLDGSIPLWDGQEATEDTRPARPTLVRERRHAIVLEPGGTIFPELAALAQEAMSEPESQPQPIDSTWLRLQLVEWERRYPIPVGAP